MPGGQLEAWTSSPSSQLIGETDDFLKVLNGFVQRPRIRGAVVHDARVAAICIAHGVEMLLTRDRDFSLFPELPTRESDCISPGYLNIDASQ